MSLTEVGYSVKVERYHLEELLIQGSPAEDFIYKLEEARKGPYWVYNESDLLHDIYLLSTSGAESI